MNVISDRNVQSEFDCECDKSEVGTLQKNEKVTQHNCLKFTAVHNSLICGAM